MTQKGFSHKTGGGVELKSTLNSDKVSFRYPHPQAHTNMRAPPPTHPHLGNTGLPPQVKRWSGEVGEALVRLRSET